ncbi:aminoglycoside adenylyltransferase family protein [Devosia sp.]|uniref:aminoglycoside adenylyltransferase family protein n=1 Tax=Devosia sp. TaxID=1871048 RepID=UPI003A8FD862
MPHEVTVPGEAKATMEVLRSALGTNLAAAYLYGSAVHGGLKPRSDVDLIAVVDAPLTPETTQTLLSGLLGLSGHYPVDFMGRRPVELTVFLSETLASFTHPLRGEFVYGEWLRSAFESGALPEPEVNPDFTLLLAQARQTAVALFGPPPTDLLPIVSPEDIRRASLGALPELLHGLAGDERNVLLTLARMWFTATTGKFTSKDAAAHWAIARLPAEHAALLAEARDAYLGRGQDDWSARQREAEQAAQLLAERATALL